MRGFVFHYLSNLGIVGLFHQVPDAPFRVAEPRERAETLGVGETHGRAINGFGLFQVRFATGGFCPVEVDLGMGAVTERFVAGLTASTKRILRRGRMFFALP